LERAAKMGRNCIRAGKELLSEWLHVIFTLISDAQYNLNCHFREMKAALGASRSLFEGVGLRAEAQEKEGVRRVFTDKKKGALLS